jgi:hypothetical protein
MKIQDAKTDQKLYRVSGPKRESAWIGRIGRNPGFFAHELAAHPFFNALIVFLGLNPLAGISSASRQEQQDFCCKHVSIGCKMEVPPEPNCVTWQRA